MLPKVARHALGVDVARVEIQNHPADTGVDVVTGISLGRFDRLPACYAVPLVHPNPLGEEEPRPLFEGAQAGLLGLGEAGGIDRQFPLQSLILPSEFGVLPGEAVPGCLYASKDQTSSPGFGFFSRT